jgi:hypothetical protein
MPLCRQWQQNRLSN